MQKISHTLKAAHGIERHSSFYYRLIDAERVLIASSQTRYPVWDGLTVSLFYIAANVLYEFYAYEFNLTVVDDVEVAYQRLQQAESRNDAAWHKRLRQFSPVFVPRGAKWFSRQIILAWIEYVLQEPEIAHDLHEQFGKEATKANLYIALY